MRPSNIETNPVVSVIIPAYNAGDHIGEALQSVFAQTFDDFEVIVIDDGSTETDQLERALSPYRERVIYLIQNNQGPSCARNAGIRRARGDFIAFLDSDDVWMPEYLAEQVGLLRDTPSLDLVYADLLNFGEGPEAGMTYMEQCPSKGAVTFESLLVEDCQVPLSATVARRRALIDAGLFDQAFRWSEDYDLWLRLAHRGGRMKYQRRVLARRRLHSHSLSAQPSKLLEGQVGVLTKLARQLNLGESARSLLQTKLARTKALADLERGKALLSGGQPQEAAEYFKSANSYLVSFRLNLVLLGLRLAPSLTCKGAEIWRHCSTDE
jgi:GT2 family glycosyltransferase